MLRAVQLVTAASCWLALLQRVVVALRRPDDRAARAVCMVFAGLALGITAQPTSGLIDVHSGIPNLGRLCGNCAALIAACGGQVLLVHLLYEGPAARRMARRRYLALALTLVLVVVTFAAIPQNPETSYASTGHMKVFGSPYTYLYLSYLAVALPEIIRLAWRYAAFASARSMRAGLRTIAVAGCCGLAYVLVKGGILAAHHLGADMTGWEFRTATPLYLATALLMLLGGALPVLGPRLAAVPRWLRTYRAHQRLRPLWYQLYQATPEIALYPPRPGRFDLRDLDFRLYRQVIEIRDGQLALRAHVHPDAAELAHDLGRQAGLAGDRLHATIEAACLATALDTVAQGRVPVARPLSAGADTDGAPTGGPDRDESGNDLIAETRYLELLAQAIKRSPVVAAVRARLAGPVEVTT